MTLLLSVNKGRRPLNAGICTCTLPPEHCSRRSSKYRPIGEYEIASVSNLRKVYIDLRRLPLAQSKRRGERRFASLLIYDENSDFYLTNRHPVTVAALLLESQCLYYYKVHVYRPFQDISKS